MKQAKWMWQYGEYELYHSMILHMRREEFEAAYPPMWRVSAPSPWLCLYCDFHADIDTTATLTASGIGYLVIDGVRYPEGVTAPISKGEHHACVRVMNDKGLAAAFVASDACPSGEGWYSRRLPDSLTGGFTLRVKESVRETSTWDSFLKGPNTRTFSIGLKDAPTRVTTSEQAY